MLEIHFLVFSGRVDVLTFLDGFSNMQTIKYLVVVWILAVGMRTFLAVHGDAAGYLEWVCE